MDVLSLLFEEMHLHNVQYISVTAKGTWCLEHLAHDYLTFIIVTQGQIILNYAEQTQIVSDNNMIMLTQALPYRCQSSASLAPSVSRTLMPAHETGQTGLDIKGVKQLPTNIEESPSDKHHVDDAHTEKTTETSFIIVRCQFDKDMATPLLSALPASLPPSTQQRSAYHKVITIGVSFFQLESSLNRPGKINMLNRLASMLMIECIREYIEQLNSGAISKKTKTHQEHRADLASSSATKPKVYEENQPNLLAALKDTYLAKTLYLMHSYPNEPWTMTQLAKEAGLSRTGLNDRFKKVIGITPHVYLSHYRLRLAARYLREEQYSINRISELVGYASDTSFHGAFKRHYGQSPSQYRKAIIQS
ncbi:AraC-like DNA-binding protein [Psychrobacter sp. PL19]|uniref:AraC family transcriptional regulator n=1 Tax=Psychrobacter sp. PL19 TaxID=2760711 RepID=UPI001AE199FD